MDIGEIKRILHNHDANEELTDALIEYLSGDNPQLDKDLDSIGSQATEMLAVGDNEGERYLFNLSEKYIEGIEPRGYEHLEQLGKGGMGEVWRVKDRVLNRQLAMKIIHNRRFKNSLDKIRFIEEAKTCAQLQHPNIIPIYELGQMDDGRIYFTMKEVEGRTFRQVIKAVHAASNKGYWSSSSCGWNLHRLMDAFHQVCLAISFAHSKGVLHRDLKPDNIMIGSYGEVLVVDWGIAKIMRDGQSELDELNESDAPLPNSFNTQVGRIVGTPTYMSPEQASGYSDSHDQRSDIYSLGVILYYMLSGSLPYTGKSSEDVLRQLLSGPPPTLEMRKKNTERTDLIRQLRDLTLKLPIPPVLIHTCDKAMSRAPEDRFSTTAELAKIVSEWLDGSKQREKALKLISQANAIKEKRENLDRVCRKLRKEAKKGLDEIPKWGSEKIKSKWWKFEQLAAKNENSSWNLYTQYEQLLLGALTHKAELVEAHESLIQHFQEAHKLAEEKLDQKSAQRQAIRLERHLSWLPESHPMWGESNRYLKGDGAVSILTDTDDVDVYLDEYVLHYHRLVPKEVAYLGRTPLKEYPLAMGSYRLRLCKKGYHEVVYPISIRRQEHWDGRDANGVQRAIHMPKLGCIKKDESYVPAGWAWIGTKDKLHNSLSRKRVWLEGFVIKSYPITFGLYLDFINSLVKQGRLEETSKYLPRRHEKPWFLKKPDGYYDLISDKSIYGSDVTCDANWPAFYVNLQCAKAYSEWLTAEEKLNWAVPNELEWEKSARGVDGRSYPWGNEFDGSYACTIEYYQQREEPKERFPSIVKAFPLDCSVYGVYGMSGNNHEWTVSGRTTDWETVPDEMVMVYRGGSRSSSGDRCHVSARGNLGNVAFSNQIGFRLLRHI